MPSQDPSRAPPLRLLILDAIIDDIESFETIRDSVHREDPRTTDEEVKEALFALMHEGLVRAFDVDEVAIALVPSTAADLRIAWFAPTEEGEQAHATAFGL
jgi:hypothetical protein